MVDIDFRVIPQFHWADYFIFSLSLGACIAIGVYSRFFVKKKTQSSADQLVGGRSMGPIPVALSCIMAASSPPFFIGNPAEIYTYGPVYILLFFAYCIVVPVIGHGFLPTIYKLKITTAYEYLERRFNKLVRAVSSGLYVLMMVFYIGVVIYTPARAFKHVTRMSEDVTILIIGAICTFYTAMGGIKAIIWNDVIQTIIIISGLIVLVIKSTVDVGGVTEVFRISSEGGRLDFENFSPNPTERHTLWTQVIGGVCSTLTITVANQAIVQKLISVRTLKDAQISLWMFLFGFLVFFFLVCSSGFVMYAFYHTCDPITAGIVQQNDQVISVFMMHTLGKLHGLPGLFTAGIFSAALSTMAAGVNALAAVIFIDIIRPFYTYKYEKEMNPKWASILTTLLAIVMGFVTMGVAYLAPLLGPTLLQIAYSLFGMIGGPLLGLLILAVFIPCVNNWGALVGLLSSLIITMWIAIGAIINPNPPIPLRTSIDGCPINGSDFTTIMTSTAQSSVAPPEDSGFDVTDIYKISYMWYGVLSIIVEVIVGVCVSLITGGHKQKVDPKTVYDYGKKCCCLSFYRKCCCMLHEDMEDVEKYKMEYASNKTNADIYTKKNEELPPPSYNGTVNGMVNNGYVQEKNDISVIKTEF